MPLLNALCAFHPIAEATGITALLSKQKELTKGYLPPEDMCRNFFLADKLIDKNECNFVTWAYQKGYHFKEP